MKIVLVFPPYVNPWSPYISLPALAGYLHPHAVGEVALRDLNIEFFECITSGKPLAGKPGEAAREMDWLEVQQAKSSLRTRELFPENDLQISAALAKLEKAVNAWTEPFGSTRLRLLNARGAPARPSEFLFPYGPCITHYEMPYSFLSSEAVRAATGDTEQNPFLRFYENGFLEEVARIKPDIVGISVAFPAQHIPAFTLARLIKEALPETHITLGGAQISKMRNAIRGSPQFHKHLLPLVDSVVIGEGERSLLNLAQTLKNKGGISGVKNLVFKHAGRIVMTETDEPLDMGSLPMPDYAQLPLGLYLNHGSFPSLPIQVTRGCYWGKCSFCDSSKLMGPFRSRPAERVLEDIQAVHDLHGISAIQFVDEALPRNIMLEVAGFISRRELPTRWSTYARFDQGMSAEFCEKIAAGGCTELFLGLESISGRVNRLMTKGVDTGQALRIMKDLHRVGIRVHLFTIIGFPSETRQEAQRTLDFLMENRDLYVSYSLAPFMLETNCNVARQPEMYGIKSLWRDGLNDLATHCGYETVDGLSMSETIALYLSFNEQLIAAGAYNPIYIG